MIIEIIKDHEEDLSLYDKVEKLGLHSVHKGEDKFV